MIAQYIIHTGIYPLCFLLVHCSISGFGSRVVRFLYFFEGNSWSWIWGSGRRGKGRGGMDFKGYLFDNVLALTLAVSRYVHKFLKLSPSVSYQSFHSLFHHSNIPTPTPFHYYSHLSNIISAPRRISELWLFFVGGGGVRHQGREVDTIQILIFPSFSNNSRL